MMGPVSTNTGRAAIIAPPKGSYLLSPPEKAVNLGPKKVAKEATGIRVTDIGALK